MAQVFPDSQASVPVQLPRTRAPRDTELVRLRLPDRPGSLAAVAAHLASYGVDVLRLEVVDRDQNAAVDDLLLSGSELGAALAELGPRALVLARRPGVDLRDPALAMAEACEAVTSAASPSRPSRYTSRSRIGVVRSPSHFSATIAASVCATGNADRKSVV